MRPFTFMSDNTDQSSANEVESGMNEVLARNIRTLLAKRRAEERQASIEQKVADAITRFTGSMPFVYLHSVFFGLWILINLGWLNWFGLRSFDLEFCYIGDDRFGGSYLSFYVHPHFPKPHECDLREAGRLGLAHQPVSRA
jgi:hypothetical protein